MMQNRSRLVSVLKNILQVSRINQEMPNSPLPDHVCQEIKKEVGKVDCQMLDFHLKEPLPPAEAEIIVADIFSKWNQIACNIFLLTNVGTKLPLHDHPKIDGFIKPLTGKLLISSFSWLTKDEEADLIQKEQKIGQKPARFEGTKLISAQNPEIVSLSHEKGNVHSIEAMEPSSSFFDALIPDYADRICEYYQIDEVYPVVGRIYWLQPVQMIPSMQAMFYPTVQIPEVECG
uniref:2-aminoethanethiol dioxygenase n=1 Tax=Panagrolaimus sp. JU765 TaxID=591449 RepID=A0AC34R0S4_9BILA